jgi:hypothetical protein
MRKGKIPAVPPHSPFLLQRDWTAKDLPDTQLPPRTALAEVAQRIDQFIDGYPGRAGSGDEFID